VLLQPRRHPGRTDRKAAAYASEIVRLRVEGYTYEVIREALADVGVQLSTSALRREVRRHLQASHASSRARSASPPTATQAGASPLPSSLPPFRSGASGREIAEAFFKAHPSNPLLRAKEVQ
jgi:hypothetical protein